MQLVPSISALLCVAALCLAQKKLCPKLAPRYRCVSNPCKVSTCAAAPNATCRRAACGLCEAVYFSPPERRLTKDACCLNLRKCKKNPCLKKRCAAFPQAQCEASTCERCGEYDFYYGDTRVTPFCKRPAKVSFRPSYMPTMARVPWNEGKNNGSCYDGFYGDTVDCLSCAKAYDNVDMYRRCCAGETEYVSYCYQFMQ